MADNPEAFGREHAADMALLGDIGATLSAAAKRLGELVDGAAVGTRLAARGARQRAAREALRAEILSETGAPLSPDAAVLAALDALPADALIANDSAATFGKVQNLAAISSPAAACSAATCRRRSGRRSRAQASSPRSPATAGRCTRPRRCGAQAHYRAKVVFFVFNNRRYGVLQNVAKSLGYANAVAGRFVGMEIVGPPIDFQSLAASMGVPSVRADERDAITAAVTDALRREGPSLIEVVIR